MNTRKKILISLGAAGLTLGAFFLVLTLWQGHSATFEAEYVRSSMAECQTADTPSQCYRVLAVELLDRFTLPEILSLFAENETGSEFFQNCHEVAHYLGQETYRRTGNIRSVFSQSSRACLGGSFHGGVEGYFMTSGIRWEGEITDAIKHSVAEICGKPVDYTRPQEFTECNHGLGHAVMFLTENDLPKALELCDELRTRGEQELCYTGAFMANADSAFSQDHPTKFIKDDDLLYPCTILPDRYASMCYTYAVLARFQYDAEKSIAICASVPSQYQAECFKTYGRDRTMVSADEKELKAQCDKVRNSAMRDQCVSGAAYNLVIRFGIDSDLSFSFCDIVASAGRDTCYRSIARALEKIAPELGMARSRCRTGSAPEYRAACLEEISAD